VKIVHIESGRHLYGGARQVAYLVAGLGRAGIDNVLVVPPGAALAEECGDTRILEVPMRGELDFKMRGRLLAMLVAERPDLVHVHSRNGADHFGGRAARAAACACVLTRRVDHSEIPLWARVKYAPYDRLIAISSRIAEQLRGYAGAARVSLIHSGVDTERFRPDAAARRRLMDAFSLPAEACVIGVVGQLIRRKGHDVFFDAFARIARSRADVRALVFGRGPLERRLEREVRARGLLDRITFAGFRRRPWAWLPGLDLLVHPARSEGLGVAVLEAMSSAVPVVASRIGGLTDTIEDGRSGMLVRPNDSQALAAALGRVLDDARLRRRIGSAARERVSEKFSVDRMIAAHVELYGTVLRERDVAGSRRRERPLAGTIMGMSDRR
jgi:glycosyltransferase involved in cell wall biosynthesis